MHEIDRCLAQVGIMVAYNNGWIGIYTRESWREIINLSENMYMDMWSTRYFFRILISIRLYCQIYFYRILLCFYCYRTYLYVIGYVFLMFMKQCFMDGDERRM